MANDNQLYAMDLKGKIIIITIKYYWVLLSLLLWVIIFYTIQNYIKSYVMIFI